MKKKIKKLLSVITGYKPYKNRYINQESIKKVLVISLYFRGDILFHSTFLRVFKILYPHSIIDIWIKNRLNDIIKDNPDINKIHIFDDIKTAGYNDKSHFNLRGKYKFIRKIKNEKYDLIIDLTGKYSTAIITLLAKPRFSIGINYNYFGFCYDKYVYLNTSTAKGHLIDKYLNVLKQGLKIDDVKWNNYLKDFKIKPYIYIDKKDCDEVELLWKKSLNYPEKKTIVIHVTSGWSAKNLPITTFAELIDKLLIKNYNLVFIGDENDRKRLLKIQDCLTEKHHILTDYYFSLPFTQSAELIRRADLFIGSDSAPLHVAGAVGTPSIGLFGPTNPEFSRPVGKQHKVIYHKLYCSSAVERQYCTLNGGFTCKTWDCMKIIIADEIIAFAEDLLLNQER